MESACSVNFMLPSLVALWLSGAGHPRIHRIGRLEANALRRHRVDPRIRRLPVPCPRRPRRVSAQRGKALFEVKGLLRTGSRR